MVYSFYMIFTYIVLAVIAVIVLWAIGAFNHLVRMTQRAKEAWADINVQLKRQRSLIDRLRLVEVVPAERRLSRVARVASHLVEMV